MTATSAIRWRSFSLHKDGNEPDEYEDAIGANPKSGRFAVVDGATESSFACLWAKLLAEGFVARRERRASADWLTPLQQRWAEAVDHLELEWFAEEKRRIGAFATFLGLSLKKPQKGKAGRWRALAVGDCCLFQIRDGSLRTAFPLTRSDEFGNRPPLLGSRPAVGGALERAIRKFGRWKKGDSFLLMTDALAQWFLKEDEQQHKPWEALRRRMAEPNPTAAMTAYVVQLRSDGELKNDDVTLLVIDL